MEKKERNEELQSRREFFKNAAKATLPILGAVLVSNVPFVANAAKTPMGCEYGCQASCYTGCFTACSNHACRTDCTTSCTGGCDRTCFGTCVGTCAYACTSSNYY